MNPEHVDSLPPKAGGFCCPSVKKSAAVIDDHAPPLDAEPGGGTGKIQPGETFRPISWHASTVFDERGAFFVVSIECSGNSGNFGNRGPTRRFPEVCRLPVLRSHRLPVAFGSVIAVGNLGSCLHLEMPGLFKPITKVTSATVLF